MNMHEEKTMKENCTPPADNDVKEWVKTDKFRAGTAAFADTAGLKEHWGKEINVPKDASKVFIHIEEEGDGHYQSAVIGHGLKVVQILESVLALQMNALVIDCGMPAELQTFMLEHLCDHVKETAMKINKEKQKK